MMRINLIVCLVAVLMMTGAARAESTILQGAYGPADIERACRSAGGRPISGAGLYGCEKDNCDGKGGTCTVICTDPLKCLATTPTRIVVPTTLFGLLQNGDMVVRGPRTGGGSIANPKFPPPPPPAPSDGTLY